MSTILKTRRVNSTRDRAAHTILLHDRTLVPSRGRTGIMLKRPTVLLTIMAFWIRILSPKGYQNTPKWDEIRAAVKTSDANTAFDNGPANADLASSSGFDDSDVDTAPGLRTGSENRIAIADST